MGLGSCAKGCGAFIWNKEEKKFCGRGGKRWGEIAVYYFFYYSCLVAFYAASVAFFYSSLSAHRPKLTGENSILKMQPGMGHRPQDAKLGNLIQINAETFEQHIASINKELDNNNYHLDLVKEHCKVNDYGYKKIDEKPVQPCVLLKLNKIFDFIPEVADQADEDLKTATGNFQGTNNYNSDLIYVTCDGVRSVDKDNMGPIKMVPEGFDKKAYPFRNQGHFTNPYVFVKFWKLTPDVMVQVACRVWAKNIHVSEAEGIGWVRFEIVRAY